MQGTVAYTASKHAVHGITKTAALEARKHNIRVNAVSPGFLLTDMVKKPLVEGMGAFGVELWKTFEARQGRSAVFEEVGDVVVLLSTPRMSLVNGQNLFIGTSPAVIRCYCFLHVVYRTVSILVGRLLNLGERAESSPTLSKWRPRMKLTEFAALYR